MKRWLRRTALFAFCAAQGVFIGFFLAERSKRQRTQSQHKTAMKALTESETRNAAILNALPDIMFLLDETGTYLDWYATDTSNLYVSPDQFLGKNVREIMPPALAEVFSDRFRNVLSSDNPASVEYTLLIGGEPKSFETRIVKCGNRRLLCIVRDVTDKKRTEHDLRQLSSKLLRLQDEERRRIARDLHDVTAQNLFAITINLESLRQQEIADLSSARMKILTECQTLCEQSLQEVRTLAYALHPPALDRLGLVPSLQWYIDGFRKRSGVDIRLYAPGDVARLPLEMETDLFRIVQEGLRNIVRHSGSHTANVRIRHRAGLFLLQIRDNGRGLLNKTSSSDNGAGFGVGLPSMRERLRRWGGHLRIRSRSDGVSLLVHVPIPAVGRSSLGE